MVSRYTLTQQQASSADLSVYRFYADAEPSGSFFVGEFFIPNQYEHFVHAWGHVCQHSPDAILQFANFHLCVWLNPQTCGARPHLLIRAFRRRSPLSRPLTRV
jgi:hypothetical protein